MVLLYSNENFGNLYKSDNDTYSMLLPGTSKVKRISYESGFWTELALNEEKHLSLRDLLDIANECNLPNASFLEQQLKEEKSSFVSVRRKSYEERAKLLLLVRQQKEMNALITGTNRPLDGNRRITGGRGVLK